MRATEVLTAHHNVLRELISRLEATEPGTPVPRRRLVYRLMAELEIHEQIEDEIFYPAMRGVSTLVPIGHAEHRQLGDQLAVLLRTDPGGEQFGEELRILAAHIEHHGGLAEETRMFPEVVDRAPAARG